MSSNTTFFNQAGAWVRNPRRAFRDMSLRPKLILIALAIVVFGMGGVTLLSVNRYTAALAEQVGDEMAAVAETQAQNLGTVLAQRTRSMQAFASSEHPQAALAAQNAVYTGDKTADEWAELDEQWVAAGDNDALVKERLQGDLPQELENLTTIVPDFAEAFLTDRYGGLVAASDRTSDYYQADEEWWQAAYNGGQGAVFIAEPELDESTGVIGVDMAVPVYASNGNQVVGILRTTLDATTLLAEFQIELGETGEVDLIFPSGEAMGVGGGEHAVGEVHEHTVDPALLARLDAAPGGHVEDVYDDIPSVIGQGRTVSVGNEQYISDLNWKVVAHQAKSEALANVQRVNRAAWVMLGILLFAGAGAAVFVGQVVAGPILNLTDAVQRFAAGDRSVRPESKARDEIGMLVHNFNRMADEVDGLMTDIEARSEALEERTRELEASQRVTLAASGHATPDDLLDLVVNLIRDQFDLYHAQVYLVDEDRRAAVLRQSTGYAGRQLLQRKHSIPLDATALVTQAIHSGEPVLVDDTSKDPNFMPNPLLPDTRSELVVPLQRGGQVIGVLDVQDREPRRFGESTINLFQSMTDQVAMLFENAELMERITDQTARLTAFTNQLRTATQIARRLNTILDPDRLAQETVEMLQSRFGLYHAHIYLLDEEARELTMHVGSGEVGRVLKERGHAIDLDAEKSLVVRAARGRHTVTVADTSLESDFMPNPLLPETRSEVAVPLIVGDDMLGVLDVQDNQPNRFSEADVDTLGILAGQIATAMQTASLFEQTQTRLRVSEALAGAQTEDEVLDVVIQQASLYPEAQVALMLVDSDAEELTVEVVRTEAAQSGLPAVPPGTRFTKESLPALEYLTPTEDFVVDNVEADQRMDPQSREFMVKMGIRSGANIPLALGDTWLGELVINARQAHFFDQQKLNLYRTLAEQGATALRMARLNEATAESERQYSELLNGLRDGFAVVSMDGFVTDCNTAFEEIVGYSLDELREMSFSELTVEKYREMEAKILEEQALTRGYTDLYEKEYYRKDGTTVPVELTVYAVQDREGNPAGFWGFIRDITARKQAEEAIRESEERFRDVALSTSDWVWEVDAQGRYIYCSDKVVDALGYTAEEMLGKTPFDAMPEEEAARVGEIFGQIVANKQPIVDLENRNVTKDGREVYLLTNGTPILDEEGNLVGYRGVDKDITERKQAEERIRESEQRFRTVADFTYDWEYWIAPDGNFIYVSPACERITGYSVEEFMEDPTLLEQITHPDDVELISQHTHVEMEREEAHEVDFRVTTRDGEERWIGHACRPVYGADGEYLGRRASNRDITEQKEAERERQEQHALLDSILTSLPVGVWVADNEFNVLLTNKTQQDMMGRQIVEEGGEAIVERYDVVHFETGELYDETRLPIVRTMSDGEPHMADNMGIRWPDGKVVPVMTSTGPLMDAAGNQVGTVAITQDITERKQAEREIRESQQLLNSFLNNFPDLAFAKDKEGTVILANRALAESFPVPDGEVIGKTVYDLVPEEVADGIWASELEVLESGEIREIQEVVPQGDEIRTKLTTKFPLYDTEGNVQGLGAVSVDITEREKAEEDRRRFTTRLETAAEISEQVGSILDPDELLQAVIPLIKERFGLYYVHVYTLDEESGMLNLRAGYGEAGEKMLAEGHAIPLDREASLVATAARTKEPVLVDDVTEDPNFMPNPLLPDTKTEVAVPSIAGGKVLGVFDVQHDQTHYFTEADLDVFQTLAAQIANAFQSAELFEQMEASEQRFRGLYESSPLGIVLNDYETGDYLEANDAFLEMVDYTLDELNELSYWDLTPKKYDEAEQAMIRSMEETGRYGPHEKEYIRQDGIAFPVVLNGVVVTDRAGRKLIWSTVEDITERKEAERALQLTRSSVENAQDAFFWFDADANFTDVSDRTCQMLGYSREELLSMRVFDVDPAFPEAAWPDLREQVKKESSTTLESQHRTKDGHQFPVQVTVSYLEFGGEEIFFSIAKDITESKQAEETLRENEERLDLAMEAANAGVWEFWPQDDEAFFNDRWFMMLGYGPDELEHSYATWRGLLHPDDLEATEKVVFAAIEKGSDFAVDFRMRTKDGGWCWIHDIGKTVEWTEEGLSKRMLGTHTNITESKEAEMERQRFTNQLRTAADLAEQVNAILDPDQLLPEVADQLKERFGLYHVHIYTLEQPPADLLKQADEEEVARIMRQRNLIMRAGSGEVGQEMLEEGHTIPLHREKSLVARAARSQKPVLVNDTSQEPDFMPNPLLPETSSEIAVPLVAGDEVLGVLDVQDNQPDRFTQSDRDVLSTMAGQIATALQNAGYFEEIQKTADRLREVDLVKSEFLASMSHELRTPLNSIIGYTEIMLMGIDSELDAETLEDVQAIYDNAHHLLHIINDVLDLTKIEAGRLEMEMEEVPVEDLIEAASKSVAGLMVDEKGVEFRVEADGKLPVLWGDRRRLDQILNNLISNAVKFTEEGSITLRAFAEDGWIRLEVEDTGVGIAREDHEKIFDRFQQLDQTVTKQREGTGLGLAITRELVQLHGGTVELESELGEGATFTVSLPVKGSG